MEITISLYGVVMFLVRTFVFLSTLLLFAVITFYTDQPMTNRETRIRQVVFLILASISFLLCSGIVTLKFVVGG